MKMMKKILISLDVKARVAIGKYLPCDVHHLVQNYESAQEMMETLTVAYEGTMEVQVTTNKNSQPEIQKFLYSAR